MTENAKIAVMSDNSGILIFNSVGIHAEIVEDISSAPIHFNQLVTDGYSIIFITESLVSGMRDVLNEHCQNLSPIVSVLPDFGSDNGYSMQKMTENCEKAVGINLFK